MDSTNAVLPGVNVTAVCSDTNQTRSAVTDSQGGYSFPELPVCVYNVRAELQGFKIVTREAPVTANAVAKTDRIPPNWVRMIEYDQPYRGRPRRPRLPR